jgi:hypothetical protein
MMISGTVCNSFGKNKDKGGFLEFIGLVAFLISTIWQM